MRKIFENASSWLWILFAIVVIVGEIMNTAKGNYVDPAHNCYALGCLIMAKLYAMENK